MDREWPDKKKYVADRLSIFYIVESEATTMKEECERMTRSDGGVGTSNGDRSVSSGDAVDRKAEEDRKTGDGHDADNGRCGKGSSSSRIRKQNGASIAASPKRLQVPKE